jgi:legumain
MKVLSLLSLLFLGANALPFGDQILQSQKFNGDIWVVLVAGSNGWYNYRHQADIYHAYQVVRNHGIPEKNIIVFHYDDLAQNQQNPTKGVVINKPGGGDVYKGVPKDYIGEDVTPKNFLGVLTGDKELENKGKKILKSGPNDHVFIYFADHGATDLIAFPSEYLYGEDLNKALKQMYQDKKYAKLVFYLEACESGSMFDKLLPQNINIYATTASNPTESSYACYYDDKRQTYLGDVYSVNWIENSDRKSLGKESLLEQFKIVRTETNTSHVEEYGDLTIANLPLTQFQGEKQSDRQLIGGDEAPQIRDAVDSGDVPIRILSNKIFGTTDETLQLSYLYELTQLKEGRQFLVNHLTAFVNSIPDLVGNEVNNIVNKKTVLAQHPFHRSCYRTFVDTFNRDCLNLNEHPYVMRKLNVFVNICEQIHLNNGGTQFDDGVQRLMSYCRQNMNGGYPSSIQ